MGVALFHKFKIGWRDPITEEHVCETFSTQPRTPSQSFQMWQAVIGHRVAMV